MQLADWVREGPHIFVIMDGVLVIGSYSFANIGWCDSTHKQKVWFRPEADIHEESAERLEIT